MTKRYIFSFAAILTSFFAYAQPSPFIPDTAYGQYGISRPNTTSGAIWLHHMLGSALQPDGKLVIAGTGNYQNSLEVVRLDATGALDTSFNHTGFANLSANGGGPWQFRDIRVAPSGNIMVGYYSSNLGNTRYTLMCITPNGTLNTAFGTAGKAEIGPSKAGKEVTLDAIDVQPDGKTIMAGGGPDALMTHKYVLARVKPNGTMDTSFGTNGIVHCPYLIGESRHMQIFTARVQADGKILCVGDIPPGAAGNPDSLVLIRYKTNGTLDTSFGTNGIVKYQDRLHAGAIRFNAAGEIYVAGRWGLVYSPDTVFIKKFSPTGSIVSSFGTGGMIAVNARYATRNEHEQLNYTGRFELLADGKMIIGGTSDTSITSAFRVSRLMPDGTMDTVFAPNGTITVPRSMRDICTNVLVQTNGRILLTGYYRTGEGSFDTARVLVMRFRDTTTEVIPPPTYIPGTASIYDGYISPNPANDGHFTLHYTNTGATSLAHYTISNMAGQTISTGNFNMQAGNNTKEFIIDKNLPPGMYILHLASSGQVTTYKLLSTR